MDLNDNSDDISLPLSVGSDNVSLPSMVDSDEESALSETSDVTLPDVEDVDISGEDDQCVFRVPSPDEARMFISTDASHDVAEYYSPPRVLPVARAMGQAGNLSLDLGTRWDFRSKTCQDLSKRLLTVLRIARLILSPPCTMFSQLMELWNIKKMNQATFEKRWAEAKLYLSHAMDCCRVQHTEGRVFVFEHPANATSWDEPEVLAVAALPGVEITIVDQCMLGLTSKSGKPMRKRTKIMSNCPVMRHRFASVGLCDRSHVHQIIEGKEGGVRRSVWAQRYPAKMCRLLAEPV